MLTYNFKNPALTNKNYQHSANEVHHMICLVITGLALLWGAVLYSWQKEFWDQFLDV